MNNDGTISCLDHGFVRLVDVMGNDAAVVQAARVSYGAGTKTPSDDRSLIRYLMRHKHTTPFEMVEFKFHVKMPIFLARQWHRHRTASINEVSARYSEVKNEFYSPAPQQLRGQDKVNKQGSSGDPFDPEHVSFDMNVAMNQVFDTYEQYIRMYGISREQARIVLPQSAYTEFYWKIDLHNLLHFLKLRMDSHAQAEIREYAFALATLTEPFAPLSMEAFRDYVLDAVTFSVEEQKSLASIMRVEPIPCANLTPGEHREFLAKMEAINAR